MRFIVALILFGNLMLVLMYTTVFTSMLSIPAFEQQYKTVRDVYKSNLKVFMSPSILEFLRNQSNIPYTKWIKNMNYNTYVFDGVVYKHDSGIYAPALRLNYEKNLYVKAEGECLMYFYDDTPIYKYVVSIATRKGFPFYDEFKHVIRLLFEGGFIEKCKKRHIYFV